MKSLRWSIPFLSCIFLLLTVPLNATMNSSYRDLQSTLERGDMPDSTAVKQLPRPRTPSEKWLRSRVTTRIDRSLDLIEEAIRETESGDSRVRYLKEWIRISLLRASDAVSIQFVSDTLSELRPGGPLDDELRYLAGQLARHTGNDRRALRHFKRIKSGSEYHDRSLLARASIKLNQQQFDQAGQLLDRYFLSPATEKRPYYWVLRGRVFEESGADSEAYIAYSHVINHYTRSLNRRTAEQRISDLPLPEALYPGQDSSRSPSSQKRVSSSQDQTEAEFTIQVGSFRDRVHARRLRQSLQPRVEHRIVIHQSRVDGRQYHRVKITGISSKSEANDLLEKLKSAGHDGFIVTP